MTAPRSHMARQMDSIRERDNVKEATKPCSHLRALSQHMHSADECRSGQKLVIFVAIPGLFPNICTPFSSVEVV